MGLEEFDEDIFKESISAIIVGEGRKLCFHFKDGKDAEIVWQSTAKKDCWTEEHKDRGSGCGSIWPAETASTLHSPLG